MSNTTHLRLEFPQWQGGNNPAYGFGADLLAWLAPKAKGPVARVPVSSPDGTALQAEDGIIGRGAVTAQLEAAREIVAIHAPETIVTLGGDCLVSLAPFAYLNELYGDKLGVLWVDSHPDVMTPREFENSHAHVLGALVGVGDPALTSAVSTPIDPRRVMVAGLHGESAYEAEFIATKGLRTCSPEELRASPETIENWIAEEGIEVLAIHLDLDVLNPARFRSVLFANPDVPDEAFDGVAQGKLDLAEVVDLIAGAVERARPVGLTIAEHLPWDALNLKAALAKLPLLSH